VPVAPPAATGACLDLVSAEERAAMEEAALAEGFEAESFCREIMGMEQPAGMPAAAPPPPPLPPEEEIDPLGLMLVLGGAALLLIALVTLVVMLLRRRGGVTVGTGAQAVEPPPMPDAFLKDINQITGEPATQVGVKPLVVGRVAGNDPQHLDYFVIDKGTVGRRHAIIQYRDFSFWLIDQGSVNGTYLNGERLEGERQLKHGDRIRFHKYEFAFEIPEYDDAGHTVFADPADATIVADATMLGETAAMAAPMEPPPEPAPAPGMFDDAVAAGDLTSEDISEDPTQVKARSGVVLPPIDENEEAGAPGSGEELFADAAETHEPLAVVEPPDSQEFDFGEAAEPDPDFDAEASAFFDDDDLGLTNSPTSPDELDREPDFEAMAEVDAEAETVLPSSPDAVNGANEDFAEAETLTPEGPAALDGTSDISLDEFMRTDTFEAPIPGIVNDDDDDATLMPDAVGPMGAAPAIDDVFDITGEGTIPPVSPNADADAGGADDDDDDDEDEAEAPTRFSD
ncbi:MAG: FHA domain-containing protein, partial [Gammaproteobacteria bacterium]